MLAGSRSDPADGVESAVAAVQQIESYLTAHPSSAVLEDGRVLFDLRQARYSIAESHGRCVLSLWSEERNLVRTVLSVQQRPGCLRVLTRRMGVAKPVAIELAPTGDRRAPSARDNNRRQYLRLIERVLQRVFPDWKTDGLRSATDLEHSFGPAYVRGTLLRGVSAEAVIGIGAEESSAMIDGVLTLGLLWLDHCRQRSTGGKGKPLATRARHFGTLKIIVPAGAWHTTAERMAWINPTAVRLHLFTLDQRSEELTEIDYRDSGNLQLRLPHAFNPQQAMERARPGVDRVLSLVPDGDRERVEVRPGSAAEVGLSVHGLEFARVRYGVAANSFARGHEISFGAGANETPLNEETEPLCRELLARLFESRRADGLHTNPLFRLQPERWLESRLRCYLEELVPGLHKDFLYTQVPAISSGERGMLDLLAVDHNGRLIVIEVKADDDMRLPLQGLDYWIRVRALNADRQRDGNREVGAFERAGYFAGIEISPQPPKLILVAPALRIHPSNEAVLRYLSPQVEWELIAVGEHWRQDLKVVFRKRSG